MKRLLVGLLCVFLCLGTGCKTSDMDASTISQNAAFAGTASALVVLSVPAIATNTQVKASIYEITKAIENVTPATNQTFAAAATPVVSQVVDKLVAEGKLQPQYAPLAKQGSGFIFSGIDLTLNKYPKIKESTANVNLVVKSFTVAFNDTFGPCDDCSPVAISKAKSKKQSKEVEALVKQIKAKKVK